MTEVRHGKQHIETLANGILLSFVHGFLGYSTKGTGYGARGTEPHMPMWCGEK